MRKIILVLFLSIISHTIGIALPNSTTIYIVRHAEKDISDPKNQDPELNEDGKLRAKALSKKLINQKIDAVFTSKFKRNKQTGQAVATQNGILIQEYDAHAYKELSNLIKSKYKNKNILIIGHSNTVLEIIESFGVSRPMPALTDSDYDYFFEIKIDHLGKAVLSTSQYGAAHRSL
jgi:2,3-bisphosphoglycerate-dependent phosphoglycerate mutase